MNSKAFSLFFKQQNVKLAFSLVVLVSLLYVARLFISHIKLPKTSGF